MKRLILLFGMIGAGLCSHTAHATPSECFASSAAVFAAHPNASHASYSLRVKKSERCWYADAFNSEAKAKAKPALHPAATVARTSEPPPAITASVLQPNTTAIAPTEQPRIMAFAPEQPRTTAVASAEQPRTMAVAHAEHPRAAAVAPAPRPRVPAIAPASLLVTVPFPSGTPPSIQIVNAQELSRLLLVEETPADFESRFSASGYKVRK